MFWQSMDGFVRNTFVKDDCVEQLNNIFTQYNIVADINATAGEGVGDFMKNENMVEFFDDVLGHRYYHVSKDEYVKRIMQRNGGDWGGKKKQFNGYVDSNREISQFDKESSHKGNYQLLDANTDYLYFGEEYLRFIGKEEWVQEFKIWSESNSTKRTLGVSNPTIDNIPVAKGVRV